MIKAVHRHNLKAHVWTVSHPEEKKTLFNMGVGAVIPGLILALRYALFIWISSFFSTKHMPSNHDTGNIFTKVFIVRVIRALVPPLFLILAVLGSIFSGIATPTESGAMGATFFALVFRGIGGDDLLREFVESLNLQGWQLVTMVLLKYQDFT